MRDDEEVIDFSKLSPELFEELCYELVERSGFHSLRWRRGGADKGRDIEALADVGTAFSIYQERWFFECKNHASGVPVAEIQDKFAWAEAERANHLALLLATYPTTSCAEWIEKKARQSHFRTHIVEGKALKRIVAKYPDLVARYFAAPAQRLLLNIKLDWRLAGILPGVAHLDRIVYQSALECLDVASLALLLAGAAAALEHDDFRHPTRPQRMVALAEAATARSSDMPLVVIEPTATDQATVDPFAARLREQEYRPAVVALSDGEFYTIASQDVTMSVGEKEFEGIRRYVHRAADMDVDVIILREPSRVSAIYGIRTRPPDQAGIIFPYGRNLPVGVPRDGIDTFHCNVPQEEGPQERASPSRGAK